MTHVKSESDVTSLAPSSPSRPVYYVQSPSGDSHDGDKSGSMQATPVFNSPTESPYHPSLARHSHDSSSSRISGVFGHKAPRRHLNEKGWLECDVIEEEGNYGDLDEDRGLSRRRQAAAALVGFFVLFTVFCLIIWGAARPQRAVVAVKSLSVDSFYSGEGTDTTGVPTKMVTVNCSVTLSVNNPATMFGIHVTSRSMILRYSEIAIATGELQKYYQPRKSHRTVSVNLHGDRVPLYGAGAGLALSSTGGAVPLTLDFEIVSRGNVVGRLVGVKHRRTGSCPLVVDSSNTKPIKFSQKACSYD